MITGSIVALVTPMRAESLDIDWPSLKELVEWHVQQGTNGIVAVGTTGESATLNVSANSPAEAIILTKAAKESGADACLLVTPYYNKPTQEGLYVHYKTIAEAVDIDQILYNVPGRTACDMQPDTVARLSKLDNIVGIKEATGDLSRVGVLKADCADGFAIYSGDDVTARELMLMGGHGDISVTANVAPKLMSDMCAAAIAGDTELAAKIDMSLAALHTALFLESNPIPVKWAVSQMGLMDNVLRLPMTPLSREHQNTVGAALNAAGITK